MTKVLMISRCPPYPLHLGDRLIIYHLARELSGRGYAIDLLAFANTAQDWDDQPWANPQVRPYFRHIEIFPEPRRGQWAYLRRALLPDSRFPRRADESWSPEMWRAIESRLSQTHYDVIHLFGGVQVYEFRRALGDVPAIIVPYESYSLYLRRAIENRAASLITRLQFRMARGFERWMFTPYRRVVVVSERDRDELAAINPALKVEVIPNGIDLSYFQLQKTARQPAALLFTGNYEYAPNVDAALRLATVILPEVRKTHPEVKVWLVGNAPPPELRALHDGETITVTGRVPDVRPYLAAATAFVCPLRLGAGIKNKVLEALAMGLPVIATPLSVDGIHVRHGHDALAVDEARMPAEIARLLGDANLRMRLSASGRVLIENRYSWARVADQYEALYGAVRNVNLDVSH